MEMKDAIIARRSVRSYTGQPLDELVIDGLAEFISGIKPLHDNIPVDVMLYEREDFKRNSAGRRCIALLTLLCSARR